MATATDTNGTGKLCAALVKAQAEFPMIPKTKTAKVKMKQGGQFSYSYADLADIISAVTPVLNKHGLAVIQLPMDDCLVTTLMHTSGESISGNIPMPSKTSPQELGSWITYLRRYSLTAILGIAADEDDDAGSAQAAHTERGNQPPATGPQPVEKKSSFEDSIRDLFDEGTGALIGHVDDPKSEMSERMTRVLGHLGFERVNEITDRERQVEFYGQMREMVEQIHINHPSPVS